MYVESVCGLNTLNNNNLKLRSYTINLRGANNLEDLLRFIRYNSRNNQSNRKGEMEKIGWYIIIGKDQNISCEQSNIAPEILRYLKYISKNIISMRRRGFEPLTDLIQSDLNRPPLTSRAPPLIKINLISLYKIYQLSFLLLLN